MADRERLTVYFSGDVQGVGFRFTAVDIARGFPGIAGFVRNLPDGRVELVAEGNRERVEEFAAAVESTMESCIRNVKKSHAAATGEFTRFTIAR